MIVDGILQRERARPAGRVREPREQHAHPWRDDRLARWRRRGRSVIPVRPRRPPCYGASLNARWADRLMLLCGRRGRIAGSFARWPSTRSARLRPVAQLQANGGDMMNRAHWSSIAGDFRALDRSSGTAEADASSPRAPRGSLRLRTVKQQQLRDRTTEDSEDTEESKKTWKNVLWTHLDLCSPL